MIEIKLSQVQYDLLLDVLENYMDDGPSGAGYQTAELSALCAYVAEASAVKPSQDVLCECSFSPAAMFPMSCLYGGKK